MTGRFRTRPLRAKAEVFTVFFTAKLSLKRSRKTSCSAMTLKDRVGKLEDKTQKNKIKFTVRVDKKL
ncbi:hypothetical protein CH380_12795 [Leptospira adleri]|uniref:Uncharacterized protein n=1 Tax=Leptospira adleri TaxID=2023186 RepID=A0A2M9YN05_9LEPT|nr:hypothetical protein CH380_12795 [Leptospira adleri]PJZ61370.1 hypothetical protein CH376_13805 [Leptospira adleri]